MPDVIDISGGYDGGRRRGASAQELLARALLQQGTSAAPVRHPLEGLGRIAQALAGAYIGREAETARQRQTAADASTLGDYMGAIARGAPAVPAMAETPLSTGGMEADQVAVMPATPGRPGIAPGRDALAAALAGGAVPAVVARNMPMLASFAAGFEKDKPKAPEGMRFTPDGRLEPIPGFVEGKGAITAAGWKPVERVAAEAQAGWKPPERLRQEAEIRAQTEARFRAPTQEPLVEIADVNSPTGTRYVPRSQAVGQPGKPHAPARDSLSADFVLPLLRKVQEGTPLTVDEQRAFDLYTRTSPLDQLFRTLSAPPGTATPPAGTPPAATGNRSVSVPVEREMVADRDTELPGVGAVRKGETVIFNPADNSFRRP